MTGTSRTRRRGDTAQRFAQEHERCDDLDSGLDGDRVWMAARAAR